MKHAFYTVITSLTGTQAPLQPKQRNQSVAGSSFLEVLRLRLSLVRLSLPPSLSLSLSARGLTLWSESVREQASAATVTRDEMDLLDLEVGERSAYGSSFQSSDGERSCVPLITTV